MLVNVCVPVKVATVPSIAKVRLAVKSPPPVKPVPAVNVLVESAKSAEDKPSNKSALRLVTLVVEATEKGAVPVATVDANWAVKVLIPAIVCAPVKRTELPCV